MIAVRVSEIPENWVCWASLDWLSITLSELFCGLLVQKSIKHQPIIKSTCGLHFIFQHYGFNGPIISGSTKGLLQITRFGRSAETTVTYSWQAKLSAFNHQSNYWTCVLISSCCICGQSKCDENIRKQDVLGLGPNMPMHGIPFCSNSDFFKFWLMAWGVNQNQ